MKGSPMFKKYRQARYQTWSIAGFFKNILFFILSLLFSIIILISLGYSLNNAVVLDRQTVSIPSLGKELEGFTILHISDLNAKASFIEKKEIHSQLRGKNFHAVCFTGNMVGKNGNEEVFFELIRQIQSLNSTASIYYIAGEEDPETLLLTPSGSDDIFSAFLKKLQAMDVIYVDRPIAHKLKNSTVWISPEYLYSIDPKSTLDAMTSDIQRLEKEGNLFDENVAINYKHLSYLSRIMETTIDAQKTANEKDVQVLLSNYPLSAEYISNTIRYNSSESYYSLRNANLLLAGTLVGGQWQLPGGQPLYVPEYGFLPDRSLVYGKRRVLTIEQHISPGLSTSNIYPFPAIRVFNSPTITLLRFTSKN